MPEFFLASLSHRPGAASWFSASHASQACADSNWMVGSSGVCFMGLQFRAAAGRRDRGAIQSCSWLPGPGSRGKSCASQRFSPPSRRNRFR